MASKKHVAKTGGSKKSVPLQPLSDRVLVKPLSEEERGTTTAFGIIIPESAQEKSSEGVVVAVGPGKFDNGTRAPMSVTVGDRVMFSKYGHEEIKIDGTEYLIVSESQILAILNK